MQSKVLVTELGNNIIVSYDSPVCPQLVSRSRIRPAPGRALGQWSVAGHILALRTYGTHAGIGHRQCHTCGHWRTASGSSTVPGASNHKPVMSWSPVVLDCCWPLAPVLVVFCTGTGACSLVPDCLGRSPTGLSVYWYLPSCALC